MNAAVSDTTAESLRLFRSGMDIASIAAERNLNTSTVYGHLASGIEQGEIRLADVIDINEHELNTIQDAILASDGSESRLKPVYEALDGTYDYEVLRCVRASMNLAQSVNSGS